jgi:dienelactone hydrolase
MVTSHAQGLFTYDAAAPLHIRNLSSEQRDGAFIRDIELVGDGRTSEAYLVEPQQIRSGAPAVVFLHYFDEAESDGDRTEFLAEAVALAGDGLVSYLPQGSFPWSAPPTDAPSDTARITDEVVRIRKGIDLLAHRPGVDAQRLAIVGHDFGAMYAALVLATDRRPKAGVLMAGVPRWSDWFLPFWQIRGDRFDYQRALAAYDPIAHIANAAPARLLLQFARDDYYIAAMTARELFRAASEPKTLLTYPTDHSMRDESARSDRRSFLADALA